MKRVKGRQDEEGGRKKGNMRIEERQFRESGEKATW